MKRYRIERDDTGTPTRLLFIGQDAAVPCVVCLGDGKPAAKALNGCPQGTPICVACYQAVKDRQVGIVRRPDGSYSVVDGRTRTA